MAFFTPKFQDNDMKELIDILKRKGAEYSIDADNLSVGGALYLRGTGAKGRTRQN